MKLPNRPTTHVTEAESWKILQACAPNTWILREVTERDYGIDAYIEISNKAGQITGDLISIQMKGTKSVRWRGKKGERIATSPSIATSTANYWERLPVPVFLFLADLKARDIYFTPVEGTIRRSYGNLADQDSMTFMLRKKLSLGKKFGPPLVEALARRERLHRDFVFHISNLVSHAEDFHQFIGMNQGRDSFMEVEPDAHLRFRALYQSCQMAAAYLGIEWKIESLTELYKRDREQFQDEWVQLHELTLDHALNQIEAIFPTLLRGAVGLIAKEEGAYWQAHQPVLHGMCATGDLEWNIKKMEEKLAARR